MVDIIEQERALLSAESDEYEEERSQDQSEVLRAQFLSRAEEAVERLIGLFSILDKPGLNVLKPTDEPTVGEVLQDYQEHLAAGRHLPEIARDLLKKLALLDEEYKKAAEAEARPLLADLLRSLEESDLLITRLKEDKEHYKERLDEANNELLDTRQELEGLKQDLDRQSKGFYEDFTKYARRKYKAVFALIDEELRAAARSCDGVLRTMTAIDGEDSLSVLIPPEPPKTVASLIKEVPSPEPEEEDEPPKKSSKKPRFGGPLDM